ncbi:hypothetical protein FSP39_000966 [Pinctada imbricata]|uniref:MATH domain-containing protein n=1 Tax=Pinctada imbricata TaxID=66713 RepID=A0AA88XXX0_PINIB|nr:hypothetical protein FSP39_000966 [Pinctada imbricata]
MAKLFRVVKLNDRFDTQVYTFLLPNKILRDLSPDVYSKDFVCGYQKWTVSFVKGERHLGSYLKLQNISPGLICKADYSFTMVNKEHFTKNETYIEKGCEFTSESDTKGRKTFVPYEDLINRTFMQVHGDFLVELELRNVVSSLDCLIKIPKDQQSRYNYNQKLESPYFGFGLFDWSISLFPNAYTTEVEGTVAFQLHRHTSFDHLCNVKYQVTLGETNSFETGLLEHTLDAAGNGEPYVVGIPLYAITRGRSSLRLRIEMFSVASVSELTIHVLSRSRNRVHLYDRDKQAWLLESDTSGKHLAFRLYYTDISHVPRKFTRYVNFNLSVLPINPDKPAVRAVDGPFYRYYVQEDLDDGMLIRTNIRIDELQGAESEYLTQDDQRLLVHVEWIDSQLLVSPTYHSLDDVARVHKHQMMREILALQAENYALEKQLYSYQKSIAKTSARGRSVSADGERQPPLPRNMRRS